MPINGFLYPGASGPPSPYEVANSVRFNDDDSPKLSRIPSSAGNTKTGTISLWVKKTEINQNTYLYMVDDGSNQFAFRFNNDKIMVFHYNGSSYDFELETSTLFRDVSAWYHIHLKIDTANSTAIERCKLYVNNQYIAFNTTISQNFNGVFFKNSTTHLGVDTVNSNHFDGYFAEFVVIDGTALEPTSFGEFDSDSPNIWKPIDVSELTFGTNGFYLDFENASNLGADVSGNSNNFTVSNLTSIDQSTDTCTNNFATMNPLAIDVSKSYTFSEGNLNISLPENAPSLATIGVSSGKWYAEVKFINNTGWHGVAPIDSAISSNTGVIQWYQGNTLYVSGSNTATWGSALSNNDIMGIALDMDNSRVTISQNGNWWGGSSYNQSAPHTYYSLVSGYDDTITFYGNSGNGTSSVSFNFGSPSFSISSGNSDANGYGNFEYSVPSGYYALNTKNLADFG